MGPTARGHLGPRRSVGKPDPTPVTAVDSGLPRARLGHRAASSAGARAQTKRALQLTATLLEQLVARYNDGATVYDLAIEFGISRNTVSRRLKAVGVQLRCGPLTQNEIDQAIALYATGLSVATVAKRLNRDHDALVGRRYRTE